MGLGLAEDLGLGLDKDLGLGLDRVSVLVQPRIWALA